MDKVAAFVKARLQERSTWLAIGAAVPTFLAVPWPWWAGVLAACLVGVLAPTGGGNGTA